ncbi:MAG TPA: hypothetical protein DCR97_00060 [Deltaproteobacteria bacterium]|nr:hypothetical protein [Deltaproteobacteria bacterium]
MGCIFGGTLFGIKLRFVLPDHHLSEESRDTVRLGTGMVATLAALVLGLLIASAKDHFQTLSGEIGQVAAKVMQIDTVLADYGPETREVRDMLRSGIASAIKHYWSPKTDLVAAQAQKAGAVLRELRNKLLELSPHNDAQRWLRSRALQLSADIADTRWLLAQQIGETVLPMPFLVLLISWLTLIFMSFGLFSPKNWTVIIVLFVCALSAAASIFFILELGQPYQGLIRISSAPLQKALVIMGQ